MTQFNYQIDDSSTTKQKKKGEERQVINKAIKSKKKHVVSN